MTCDEAKIHLWEYYDEACEAEVRNALEAHLAACAVCRQSLSEWTALSHRIFTDRRPVAPPYLWTRVLARIEALEERRASWWLQWRWMSEVTLVMTLLVSLGAVYFFQDVSGSFEGLLRGQPSQSQVLQLASTSGAVSDEEVSYVVGGAE